MVKLSNHSDEEVRRFFKGQAQSLKNFVVTCTSKPALRSILIPILGRLVVLGRHHLGGVAVNEALRFEKFRGKFNDVAVPLEVLLTREEQEELIRALALIVSWGRIYLDRALLDDEIRNAQMRSDRIEEGKCVLCTENPAIPGRSVCLFCDDAQDKQDIEDAH
jgi:hypothetical protein